MLGFLKLSNVGLTIFDQFGIETKFIRSDPHARTLGRGRSNDVKKY